MANTHRTRPHRYDKNGNVLPPLPPAPLKKSYLEQRTRQLKQRPANYVEANELRRRATQKDVAATDDEQARKCYGFLFDLCKTGDFITAAELLNYLTTQRPSLRRRFVELVRHEASKQTDPLLAAQLRTAGVVVERKEKIR